MHTTPRRIRPTDVAAAAYAGVFLAWLALRTPHTPATQIIDILAFLPLGPVVAWVSWRNSRLPGIDGRTRIAWRLLALSAVILWVSGTGWTAWVEATGLASWPAWLDQLESVHNPLVIAAILAFPGRRLAGRSRARFLLDASLTLIATIDLALYYGVRLHDVDPHGRPLLDTVLGPGLDLAMFLVAAIASTQKRDRGTRAAVACLALTAAAYLVANYYYTLATSGPAGFTYRAGDAVDALWFCAWSLRWLAARLAHRQHERDLESPAREARAESAERSTFSYLVVVGLFVVLAIEVFAGDRAFLPVLASSVGLMVALLLARQMVELRENRRLFAERLLQESRFRSFVQHASDIVLVVDAEGVVSYASPTVARALGEKSPVRKGASLARLIRDDDQPALAAMLARRSTARRALLHLPTDDGGWRDVEAAWSDLRADPAVGGIVVNCRDVTERNELARRLRHGQKLDAVGHLAGGLAHDLNNVLAIIRGYLDLLKAQVEAGSAAAEDLGHAEQAVNRAATLTRKVLALSRKQPVHRVVLDLNAVTRDLLAMLRQSVGPPIEIVLHLADGLWAVRADRGQIEQVLVNLAANARDAMPTGGVLDISTFNRTVTGGVPAAPGLGPGDYVAIVVRDTGTGMTAEVKERVFEPFFSTKSSAGGMGLGLAMVHGIVLDSGGQILVDSEQGQGASFTILLPRTDAPVVQEGRPPDAPERPDRRATVLVVDDETHVRTIARRLLERNGFATLEAADGAAALALLGDLSVSIDVLLTDLVMPGIHGRELIGRCAELRPSLPVVCMTGFAGEGDDSSEVGAALVTVLSKPFSAEQLHRAIAAALGRGRAT
jgi:PAS domain S-box-containing protein